MTKKYILNQNRIDRIESLDVKKLTCEDISPHYGTGQAATVMKRYEKVSVYRKGIGTNVGDIELSVWREIVRRIIERDHETDIFNNLLEYIKEDTVIHRNKEEQEHEALELYARRIFEEEEWLGFVPFNERYYPERLKTTEFVKVRFSCCGEITTMTRARAEWSPGKKGGCPKCKCYAEYEICET